jgi:hypothetical protein
LKHPFAGAVGLDTRPKGKKTYGTTFEQFFIPRFNLPRVLLLDVDGRVAWEGEPGYGFAEAWAPGAKSLLDVPMEELVARRGLKLMKEWLVAWDEQGGAQLGAGDLAKVLPLLKQAESMRQALEPTVVAVRAQMLILRAALQGVEGTVAQIERQGGREALPVVPTLFAWSELLGQPVPEETKKSLAQRVATAEGRELAQLYAQAKTVKKAVQGKEGLEAARSFLSQVRRAPAPLSALYATLLEEALAIGKVDVVAELLEESERRVNEGWIAKELFGW